MDGILIINKPKGYTSHDIVNIVKKRLTVKKAGHTGTLDPNATGVLPILIGNATKASKYLVEHDKTYIAKLCLGEKTTTGDMEGNVIEKMPVSELCSEYIMDILQTFKGKSMQIPPIFSAIKVNGKKAYEYARKGQTVVLEPREIDIYSIDLIELKNNIIKFKVNCSKGTYIRTLCENIANKMNTVGYMQELQRIEVSKFKIEDATDIDNISEEKIISIEKVFMDNPEIELDNAEKRMFLNGVIIQKEKKDGVYRIYNDGAFVGLGEIKNKLLKRDIII